MRWVRKIWNFRVDSAILTDALESACKKVQKVFEKVGVLHISFKLKAIHIRIAEGEAKLYGNAVQLLQIVAEGYLAVDGVASSQLR